MRRRSDYWAAAYFLFGERGFISDEKIAKKTEINLLALAIFLPILSPFLTRKENHATRQKSKNEEVGCQTFQNYGDWESDPQSLRQAALVELQESETAAALGNCRHVGCVR